MRHVKRRLLSRHVISFEESCDRDLYVQLKHKTFRTWDETARKADLFVEARGKGQRESKEAPQGKTENQITKRAVKPTSVVKFSVRVTIPIDVGIMPIGA